jgi:hypothetical protein
MNNTSSSPVRQESSNNSSPKQIRRDHGRANAQSVAGVGKEPFALDMSNFHALQSNHHESVQSSVNNRKPLNADIPAAPPKLAEDGFFLTGVNVNNPISESNIIKPQPTPVVTELDSLALVTVIDSYRTFTFD